MLKQQGKDINDYLDQWTPTMVDKAKSKGVYHSIDSGYIPKAGDVGISNDYGHAFLIGENGGHITSPQAGRQVYEGKSWKNDYPDVQGFISLAEVIGSNNALSTENFGKPCAFYLEGLSESKVRRYDPHYALLQPLCDLSQSRRTSSQ